jgi:hypothetical protein
MCSSRDKMIRREFCWHFRLHICRHPRVAEYYLPVSSWLCPIDVHMMKFAHRHVWMCFPFLRPSEVPGAWFHAVAAVALRRVAQGVRWQPESFARMAFGTRWFSQDQKSLVATVLGGNQPDVTARKSYQPEHGCCYSCYYCRMVIPLFDAKCYWIILISRKPRTTNLDPHDNVTGMMVGISQKLSPGKSCFRGELFKVHTGWSWIHVPSPF